MKHRNVYQAIAATVLVLGLIFAVIFIALNIALPDGA